MKIQVIKKATPRAGADAVLPVVHRRADGAEKELSSLHNPVLVPCRRSIKA